LHRKHDNQAESLLRASVYGRTFLRDEHANIGPFEQPTARGTGHCRQTVAVVDLWATLAGSFCYNFSKVRGLQDHPLTAHLHVALGKPAHHHFAKCCLLKVHLQKFKVPRNNIFLTGFVVPECPEQRDVGNVSLLGEFICLKTDKS
jgi:hypothetical protein